MFDIRKRDYIHRDISAKNVMIAKAVDWKSHKDKHDDSKDMRTDTKSKERESKGKEGGYREIKNNEPKKVIDAYRRRYLIDFEYMSLVARLSSSAVGGRTVSFVISSLYGRYLNMHA